MEDIKIYYVGKSKEERLLKNLSEDERRIHRIDINGVELERGPSGKRVKIINGKKIGGRKELEKRKKEEGISKFEKLMTERERKIATVTGKIKKVTNASSLACGCHCTGIVNIEKVGRELTCDEKIKLDAVRKKVNIIKNNKDAGKKCTINLYDEEFEDIQVNTSLKYALLSTLNIENGKVGNIEDKIIAGAMPAPVTKNEPNPEITTQTGNKDKKQ